MNLFHPGPSWPHFSRKIHLKAAILSAALFTIMGAETSMASPAEEARIAGVISAVAIYADNHDFGSLERFFAPETWIDYTSLWGGEPQSFAPSALMDAWANLLPGFDVTRHELSDVQIEIDDDAATAQAKVRATHWLGGRAWVVVGYYEYILIRTDANWQVSHMTLRLGDESGDRQIVEKAAARIAGAK